MLEQIARDNNDGESLLKYCQQELEIRRMEMAYLQKVSAPKSEVDDKTAQVATALERVASAQAELALFDPARFRTITAPAEAPHNELTLTLAPYAVTRVDVRA